MVRLVIMAAGRAVRMGRDKLALPWQGSTVLGKVIDTSLKAMKSLEHLSGIKQPVELIVVARQPISTYLPAIVNERFAASGGVWLLLDHPQPLADNIKAALGNITDQIEGIGFLPGDQIGVESEQLAGLIRSFLQEKPDFLVPFAGNTAGSPVLFHAKYLPELQELKGEEGGKIILARYPSNRSIYQVSLGFVADVDTPEDYERYKGTLL